MNEQGQIIAYYMLCNSPIFTTWILPELLKFGYREAVLSDPSFTFCSHIIIHKDFNDDTPVYDNLSDGYLNMYKESDKIELHEVKTIDGFIESAKQLAINIKIYQPNKDAVTVGLF